jgi:Subtilase family/Secretion system C-terminal sorting domain/Domain of unknown function DUF11
MRLRQIFMKQPIFAYSNSGVKKNRVSVLRIRLLVHPEIIRETRKKASIYGKTELKYTFLLIFAHISSQANTKQMEKQFSNLAVALFFLVNFYTNLNYAQTSILLKAGKIDPQKVQVQETQERSSEVKLYNQPFQNKTFRLVQFKKELTFTDEAMLVQAGIQVSEYVDQATYILVFAEGAHMQILDKVGSLFTLPILPEWKLHSNLSEAFTHTWAHDGDWIKVRLILFSEVEPTVALNKLKTTVGIRKIELKRGSIYAEVHKDAQLDVAALPFIEMIELITPPAKPDDVSANSAARIQMVSPGLELGLTGKGVHVLLRDDGLVEPHIDLKGRLSNLTAQEYGTHGDACAGVIAAAGNLNPDNMGVATGANVFVIPYESTFLDNTLQTHQNNQVMITNSSYTDGCNTGYTASARTVDEQIALYPSLMHVFSSGNSNFTDCGYGAGNSFGNITGGHKQGKNCMTVGNVNDAGAFVSSSSKGPATDGRIKPDLVAPGWGLNTTDINNTYRSFSGTSASAPFVAGGLALLYEGYRNANAGQNPPSALVKAAVLNTSLDLGNPGPDFTFGYGLIQLDAAHKLLTEKHHFTGTIQTNDTKTHILQVPAGTRQMRVMLYWADPAASVLAAKALVNNLDLEGFAPDFSQKLPYILDHRPNLTGLNAPATNGRDLLNNMEQIVYDFPITGTFQFKVSGTSVPRGPQTYWLVYEMVTDEIQFTYPNGGEHFVPGQTIDLQWRGTGNGSSSQVQYSPDNGVSWTVLGNFSPITKSVSFTFPATVRTTSALFSIINGTRSDRSDATCVSMPNISGLNVAQINTTQSRIYWNKHAQAVNYEVFQLGTQYMKSIGFTADTNFVITTVQGWVSVRPIFSGSKLGKRSPAAKITQTGAPNCNQTASVANLKCNQNNTPNKASDDTYTFDLTISNTGQCGTSYITNLTGSKQTAYGLAQSMGPFLMSGGAVNVQVTDATIPAVTTVLHISPPAACASVQNPCISIAATVWNVACSQNGTPYNASDDTYTFDMVVNAQGICAGAWISAGINGSVAYGQTRKMGPYLMTSGITTLVVKDANNQLVTSMVQVQPPPSCALAAPVCNSITAQVSNLKCIQNGTPSNATDDTYTFDVIATANGSCGTVWTSNHSGSTITSYGIARAFGPYTMNLSSITIQIQDQATQVSTSLNITAPPACAIADICKITASATNVRCNQNGTPNNALDDTFTFDVKVNPSSGCGTAWSTSQNPALTIPFTATQTMGPYAMQGGAIQLQIRDTQTPNTTTLLTVAPPLSCAIASNCAINTQVSNVKCDQNGTPTLATDDTYTFDLSVSTTGTCSTNWTTNLGDGVAIPYTSSRTFGHFPMTNSTSFQIRDVGNPSVFTTINVNPPVSCASTAPTNGCADNLITNHGFDTNTLSGWSISPSVQLVLGGNKNSTYAAQICGWGNQMSQSVFTGGNAEYDLSFFAKARDISGTLVVSVKYYDPKGNLLAHTYSPAYTLNTNWTRITYKTTALSATARLEVAVQSFQSSCMLVDEFCLVRLGPAAPPTMPDLELNLSASNPSPGIYGYSALELKIKNTGTALAEGIKTRFIPFSQAQTRQNLSFVSHMVNKGTYENWTGYWTIPTLAPGEIANLQVFVFTLSKAETPCFAQITQVAHAADTDSSPNNNSSGIPLEDDEARIVLNLSSQNLQSALAPIALFEPIEVASIFPNPATRLISISLQNMQMQDVKISILDLNGQEVSEQKYSANQAPEYAVMDISQLANGIYSVRIEATGKRTLVRKMVKIQE